MMNQGSSPTASPSTSPVVLVSVPESSVSLVSDEEDVNETSNSDSQNTIDTSATSTDEIDLSFGTLNSPSSVLLEASIQESGFNPEKPTSYDNVGFMQESSSTRNTLFLTQEPIVGNSLPKEDQNVGIIGNAVIASSADKDVSSSLNCLKMNLDNASVEYQNDSHLEAPKEAYNSSDSMTVSMNSEQRNEDLEVQPSSDEQSHQDDKTPSNNINKLSATLINCNRFSSLMTSDPLKENSVQSPQQILKPKWQNLLKSVISQNINEQPQRNLPRVLTQGTYGLQNEIILKPKNTTADVFSMKDEIKSSPNQTLYLSEKIFSLSGSNRHTQYNDRYRNIEPNNSNTTFNIPNASNFSETKQLTNNNRPIGLIEKENLASFSKDSNLLDHSVSSSKSLVKITVAEPDNDNVDVSNNFLPTDIDDSKLSAVTTSF